MFSGPAWLLAQFYSFTHSYAASIALITVVVMAFITPLTLKSTKGMLEMQKLQPEMKKLQNQYRSDRQKLNEEMMKLYQEHKINPLGGCLPMLIQAPIFIILYRVIRKLTLVGDDGFFTPSYVSHTSQLYLDLHKSKEMLSFGLDLSHSAVQQLQDNFFKGLPYLVMVFLVGLSSWYQQRQIMARNANNSQVNPTQQAMMKMMPIIFTFVLAPLAVGLLIYYSWSNLLTILQQYVVMRRHQVETPIDRMWARLTGKSPATTG